MPGTYLTDMDTPKEGDTATARCLDPDGNEHKIIFIYTNGMWEIQ